MVQQRQVAYKVWISDLIKGKYVKQIGEWEPNYIVIGKDQVSRVNIIASVVNISSFNESSTIDLDDGSGVISVRTWKEDVRMLDEIEIGDLVLVIGRCKEFNDQIYLTPEIVRKINNASWAKIRKLELIGKYGEPEKNEKASSIIVSEIPVDPIKTDRQRVLNLIGSRHEISYDDLIRDSGLDDEQIDKIIKELIKEGEVYQPKPNFLRVI